MTTKNDLTRTGEAGNASSPQHASTTEKAARVLTIDRSKWRTGGDSPDRVDAFGFTYLLNGHGYMCCLGFDALACGLSADSLLAQPDPVSLYAERVGHEDYYQSRVVVRTERDEDDFEYDTTELSMEAAGALTANDDPGLTGPEREQRVRAALIALGWDDVVFIDGETVEEATSHPARILKAEGSPAIGSATRT